MGNIKPGRKSSSVGKNMPSALAREAIAEALCSEIQSWRLSQARAAARLGIHRTNLNRLLQGDLSRFALGHLMDMAAAAGIQVEFIIRDPISLPYQAPAGLFQPSQHDYSKHLYVASRASETGAIE